MQPNIDEALRYLGIRSDPENTIRRQMTLLANEISAQIKPRFLWRMMPLTRRVDGTLLGDILLTGQSAERMLHSCQRCAVLTCTLGIEFDTLVRRMQVRDMSRAVMLDALGSAYVEAACDEAEEEIRSRCPGMYLTDRFSPGYGDLPLALQPQLLDLCGGQRLGVTVTPSFLMIPQKSVTALIGVSDSPQMARIRGCAHCSMNQSCTLRKAGKTCAV